MMVITPFKIVLWNSTLKYVLVTCQADKMLFSTMTLLTMEFSCIHFLRLKKPYLFFIWDELLQQKEQKVLT